MGFFRKDRLLLATACLIGGAGPALWSAGPPEGLPPPPPLPDSMLEMRPLAPPPDLPDPSELIEQLRQLESLLSMAPDKLQRLRHTIEFIEKMSPEEREAMRIRLSQVTRMTGALRQEIEDLRALAPDLNKSDLSQFWLAATDAERESLRDRLQALPPEEQAALLVDSVARFIGHRDEVFARMKASLEAKREALESPGK